MSDVNGTTQGNAALVRTGFEGTETLARGETVSTALAEQAKAAIQARYVMAKHNPRDMMIVQQRIMMECKRPGFAQVARYSKPIGKKPIVGFSIRFAEAAVRHMGNALMETAIIYEDGEKRLVRVTVTDLESNTTYPAEIMIQKSVERKFVKEGQVVIGKRANSYGDTVYLVEANEDELLVKQQALVSKAMRTNILRLIPGDILDDAEAQIAHTLNDADAKDPTAARKGLVEAFNRVGVTAAHLAEYLGHAVDAATQEEMNELRLVGSSIKEGETTWAEALALKTGKGESAPTNTAGDAIKEKLKTRTNKAAKETPPTEQPAGVAAADPKPITAIPPALTAIIEAAHDLTTFTAAKSSILAAANKGEIIGTMVKHLTRQLLAKCSDPMHYGAVAKIPDEIKRSASLMAKLELDTEDLAGMESEIGDAREAKLTA